MPLRKEIADEMRRCGFLTKEEIIPFGQATKPDGSPQDIEKIIRSKTFAQMLLDRQEWWRGILTPKGLGGRGKTYEEGIQILKNHYKMNKRRRLVRDIFWMLKQSYRPKERITSPRAFRDAIIKKSIITRDLGKYGQKLKLRYYPRTQQTRPLPRCRHCSGSGYMRNIVGDNQMCLFCGGSGVSNR